MSTAVQQQPVELDFEPLPVSERRAPGRVKNVSVRLRVGEFREHQQADDFLSELAGVHGQSSRTLIRALLTFRDQVVVPLENGVDSEELRRWARMAMTPKLKRNKRIQHLSVRLSIDKWREHREVYEFLRTVQETHGEGSKTIIRALLYYREKVYQPMHKRRLPAPRGKAQMAAARQRRR